MQIIAWLCIPTNYFNIDDNRSDSFDPTIVVTRQIILLELYMVVRACTHDNWIYEKELVYTQLPRRIIETLALTRTVYLVSMSFSKHAEYYACSHGRSRLGWSVPDVITVVNLQSWPRRCRMFRHDKHNACTRTIGLQNTSWFICSRWKKYRIQNEMIYL